MSPWPRGLRRWRHRWSRGQPVDDAERWCWWWWWWCHQTCARFSGQLQLRLVIARYRITVIIQCFNVPWFFFKISALYKSFTYLLTFTASQSKEELFIECNYEQQSERHRQTTEEVATEVKQTLNKYLSKHSVVNARTKMSQFATEQT